MAKTDNNDSRFCDISSNEIYIYDVIDEEMSLDIIRNINKMSADDRNPITVYINSPGGALSDGICIYELLNTMRRNGVPIITVATGECQSMAALIFLVGTSRIVGKHCYYMLHDFMVGSYGVEYIEIEEANNKEARSWFDDFVKEAISDTKMTFKQLKDIWNKTKTINWRITPEDMIKFGIAHEILGKKKESKQKKKGRGRKD